MQPDYSNKLEKAAALAANSRTSASDNDKGK